MAKINKKKVAGEESFDKINIVNLTIANTDRTPKGIKQWRSALTAAESTSNPQRKYLLDLYKEIVLDPHVSAVMTKRVVNVLDNTIKFFDSKGEEDESVYKIISQPFFNKLCTYILESVPYGFSNIYFDNISPEGGSICRLIPRENVKPERGIVVKNYSDDTGVSYLDSPNCNYVIFVGNEKDLGLLCKAAPYALYKKDDMSDWSTYAQVFGTPFRYAQYDGFDVKVKKELETMMSRSLTAPWAVLPKGTDFKMTESSGKSGSADLYHGLADFVNKEISKLFLGNTMTLDAAGGNYKGEVHEKSELRIAAADKALLLSVLNTDFVRLLETFGIKAEGGYFAFDESEDLSMSDRLELDMRLATMIDIPDNYWYETYSIPRPDGPDRKEKKQKPPDDDAPNEPNKDATVRQSDGNIPSGRVWDKLINKLTNFFPYALSGRGLEEKTEDIYSRFSCAECGEIINLSRGDNFTDHLVITAFSGDMELVEKIIFERNYSRLSGAVDEVFGKVKYGDTEYSLTEKLRNSTARFSAYKTAQEVKILEKYRLDSSGKPVKYDDYKNKVIGQIRAFSHRYLATERHTAITRSRIALQWQEMASNTVYTNIRWLPSRAANPREAHIPFYNKIWAASDPFWATNSPGTLWGCMCGIEATDEPTSDNKITPIKSSPGLDNNPGVSGEIFTKTHPVFSGLKGSYIKDAKRLTNNNTWSATAGEDGLAVRVSKGHAKHELSANKKVAERLTAIDGSGVDLLGINKTGESYDSFRHGPREYWEFKTPTGRNIKNAIQNELKHTTKERFLFALSQHHSVEQVHEALVATFIANKKRAASVKALEFLFPGNLLLRLDRGDLISRVALQEAIRTQRAAWNNP